MRRLLSLCRSTFSLLTPTNYNKPKLPSPFPTRVQTLSTSSTKMSDITGINHRMLKINGINMHVAEKGDEGAPIVLLLHGFPDLWYSWRHQISSLASLGYRAVAPDMRGFGDTDAPTDARSYTYGHLVGDLVGLIDELGAQQVFVVAHDWGAIVAWWFALFRPDRIKALVSMSVPFSPRNPKMKPLDMLRGGYGDDHYICRFQEPGEMEKEVAEAGGAENLLGKIYGYGSPKPLFMPKGALQDVKLPNYPDWMSSDEITYFQDKFNQTGFTGGFNYYRALNLNWEITAPWTKAQVKVPVKFMVGDQDLTYNAPGVKDYVNNGGMKRDVPLLQDVVILPGVGHFLQHHKPHLITDHIYDFIKKF